MIFTSLRGLLVGDPAFFALIGDRCWFLTAPANRGYPDVIQYPAAGSGEQTLEGTAAPWLRRISFECRAESYDGARGAHAVGDHVLRILGNFAGVASDEKITGCFLVSDLPLIDETSSVRRRVLDFNVHHAPA